MSSRRWQLECIAAGFGAGLLLAGLASAQDSSTGQPASVEADSVIKVAAAVSPPPLPTAKSPVDFFRELLAMSPAERKELLANRSPEDRKRILAKLREYEWLKPDQRELRLRATELRWYLLPLMNIPPAQRAAQLPLIPPDVRKLVEARLQQWDKLAAEVRKELLENEATILYFTQLESATEEQRQRILEDLSPARREKLQASIARWRSLPEPERQKMCDRFNQFFDLTPNEKQRTLNTLSDAERRQMEKTLRTFEKLPREQRVQCLRSFEKFASMSLEERQLFLKNAERWCLMSPDEREAWRDLVRKVPEWPPSPPGMDGTAPPPPPAPPGLPRSVALTNKS